MAVSSEPRSLDFWAGLGKQVIFLVADDGTCLDVSSNVGQQLGWPPDTVIGRPLEQFVCRAEPAGDSDQNGRLRNALAEISKTKAVLDFEFPFLHASGHSFSARCRGTLLETGDGKPQTTLIVLTDASAGDGSQNSESDTIRDDQFHASVGSISHTLNNLLTALQCQWGLAFELSGGEPPRPETLKKIKAILGDVITQAGELTRAYSGFMTETRSDGETTNR